MLSIEKEFISIYPLSLSENLTNMEMDVLVLDCGRDPVRGIKYLQKFKSIRPDIPVIFLTDESSEEIVIRAFKAGARDFFKKPFELNELKDRIERLVEFKRSSKKISPNYFFDLKTETPPQIIKTLNFIYEHMGEKITIKKLAQEAGLSRFHFCRMFKKFIGLTPKKFIFEVRLKKAKTLLQLPEKTISKIAFEVGFDDPSNFSKYFKQYTGLTPLQYRKKFLESNTSIKNP
jgi:AraC-like DNA-binding protein